MFSDKWRKMRSLYLKMRTGLVGGGEALNQCKSERFKFQGSDQTFICYFAFLNAMKGVPVCSNRVPLGQDAVKMAESAGAGPRVS